MNGNAPIYEFNNTHLPYRSKPLKVKIPNVCWGLLLFAQGNHEFSEFTHGRVIAFTTQPTVVDFDLKLFF